MAHPLWYLTKKRRLPHSIHNAKPTSPLFKTQVATLWSVMVYHSAHSLLRLDVFTVCQTVMNNTGASHYLLSPVPPRGGVLHCDFSSILQNLQTSVYYHSSERIPGKRGWIHGGKWYSTALPQSRNLWSTLHTEATWNKKYRKYRKYILILHTNKITHSTYMKLLWLRY